MNRMKKMLAGTLTAATVLASLTSCGSDTTWAYRSGDITVTSGMYIGLSVNAVNAASSLEDIDTETSIFSQQLEGYSAENWLKMTTETYARNYIAVEKKFDEMGLTLSEENLQNIDSQVAYIWALGLGDTYEEMGCGKTSYTNLVTNSYKKSLIFEALYGEGGEKEVPVTELQELFKKNYCKGVVISVSLLDEEGELLTGKALELQKEKAQELADRIENGEDIETVKAEYLASLQEDSETDTDEDSTDEQPDTALVLKAENATTVYGTAIKNGAVDEVQVVEDTKVVYVIQTKDVMTSFEDYQSTVLSDLKSEEFESTVTDWGAAVNLEKNEASVKKHSPKNLKKYMD